MNLGDIKDWLIPISSFIGIVPTAILVWLSLKEHRLKLQAETRLAESARAETDIRLLQLFTEILYIASGRKGEGIFSKEILDLLIEKNILTEDDFGDVDKLKAKISKSVVAQTPGIASVDAAFASIATLANRHPVLRDPAIAALESFRKNYRPELSEKYLNSIRKGLGTSDITTEGKLS